MFGNTNRLEETGRHDKALPLDHSAVIVTLQNIFCIRIRETVLNETDLSVFSFAGVRHFLPRTLFITDTRSLIYFRTCIPKNNAIGDIACKWIALRVKRSIACFGE